MLKKYELHDRTGQPVVDRDTLRESNHEPVGCSSFKYTTIGLRLSGHGAAEVDVNLTEEHKHAEINPTCKIHEGRCTSR